MSARSLNRSAPPVTLELRASRAQRALIALAVIAAVAAVWLSGLPSIAQLAASVLAIALAWRAWLAASRWAGARFVFEADATSRVRLADGAEHEVSLVDATLLGPLIAVRMTLDGKRADLALFPDSADAEDLRRLRVLLRHGVKL